MDEPEDDYSEEIAGWLKDIGHRHRSQSAAETAEPTTSAEELIEYLQALTGRQFRSREDVLRLLKDVWEEDAEAARIATRHQVVREGILLGALAASYLHYYYWDVELQIAALPTMQVFVPAPPLKSHQHSQYLIRAA